MALCMPRFVRHKRAENGKKLKKKTTHKIQNPHDDTELDGEERPRAQGLGGQVKGGRVLADQGGRAGGG
jgi:hypothetical protein